MVKCNPVFEIKRFPWTSGRLAFLFTQINKLTARISRYELRYSSFSGVERVTEFVVYRWWAKQVLNHRRILYRMITGVAKLRL